MIPHTAPMTLASLASGFGLVCVEAANVNVAVGKVSQICFLEKHSLRHCAAGTITFAYF